VAAYAYAHAGGPPPEELILDDYLTRFGGALNVLGRPLGAGEIFRMSTVKNIINWYKEREASPNWAAWEKMNPEKSKYLSEIHEEYIKHAG
jgi:hypothetical protein